MGAMASDSSIEALKAVLREAIALLEGHRLETERLIAEIRKDRANGRIVEPTGRRE